MEREELLKSKEYWFAKLQTQLFGIIETYRKNKNLNRTQLANELNVTKGYVSQVLNGDFDHRLSKFVDLSLSVGKVPFIEFKDLEELIKIDGIVETGAVYSVLNATTVNFFDGVMQVNNFYSSTLGDLKNMTNSPCSETFVPINLERYEERKKIG